MKRFRNIVLAGLLSLTPLYLGEEVSAAERVSPDYVWNTATGAANYQSLPVYQGENATAYANYKQRVASKANDGSAEYWNYVNCYSYRSQLSDDKTRRKVVVRFVSNDKVENYNDYSVSNRIDSKTGSLFLVSDELYTEGEKSLNHIPSYRINSRTFVNWYIDRDLTTPYDFSKSIVHNNYSTDSISQTLYAKFSGK